MALKRNCFDLIKVFALTLLLSTSFPLFAQADSFILFGKDYGKSSPKFLRLLRENNIQVSDYKDIDGTNNPEEFISLLEAWSTTFPEKSNLYIRYPNGWFSKLTEGQKERLRNLNTHYHSQSAKPDFLALSKGEQLEGSYDKGPDGKPIESIECDEVKDKSALRKWCNSSDYRYSRWNRERYGNAAVVYNGNVSYEYIDNPDKSSDETRIYDGHFRFWNNSNKREVHRLEGDFQLDKQTGKWSAEYLGYQIEFNFNDAGELDGEFVFYRNRHSREEKKVYSGTIKNGYVSFIEYSGEWRGHDGGTRKINSKGRYGIGNGHPAGIWKISIINDPDYRPNDIFFHLPQGDYTVQFAKYANGYKLEENWGDTDNWVKADCTVCTFVDPATGKRKDAGKTIIDIPRRLSDDIVDILNHLVLRESTGLKYSYFKD